MKQENIITGEHINITVRPNATFYEIMQEIVRESARTWKQPKNKAQRLKEIRIFEKYALKYGLQRELKEMDIL